MRIHYRKKNPKCHGFFVLEKMPEMSQASRVGSRPTKSRGIFLWNLVVDSSTED